MYCKWENPVTYKSISNIYFILGHSNSSLREYMSEGQCSNLSLMLGYESWRSFKERATSLRLMDLQLSLLCLLDDRQSYHPSYRHCLAHYPFSKLQCQLPMVSFPLAGREQVLPPVLHSQSCLRAVDEPLASGWSLLPILLLRSFQKELVCGWSAS